MNEHKQEITDSFWIVGQTGHKYRVLEITQFTGLHGYGGQLTWVPGKRSLRTDGFGGVNDHGNGEYSIPVLGVNAKRVDED